MSFPRQFYGDPAKVLEMKQGMEAKRAERAAKIGKTITIKRDPPKGANCARCSYKVRLFEMDYCDLGNTVPGANKMQPCHRFKDSK